MIVQRRTDRRKEEHDAAQVAKQHRRTVQALPKIGLGTHFSDLSNILPKGAEVVVVALELSAWRLDVLEGAGFADEVGLFDVVAALPILRFWKALLIPLPDAELAVKRVDDDAGEEDDEEACLQLCWLGAR